MQVANDTEDDVLYTVDDPGDPRKLRAKSFQLEPALTSGCTVRFFVGLEQVAISPPMPEGEAIVILKKKLLDYEVRLLMNAQEPVAS